MEKQAEYIEKLSAEMVAWDVQIDQLKDKAKSGTPETGHEYSAAISALQIKRDEAAQKLQGISTASGDEWHELKSGTDRVWDEVSGMLHDAIMKTT